MARDANTESPMMRAGPGAIGQRLREMFDSVASGPMPEHLLALVDQLEVAYQTDCLTAPASASTPR